MEEKINYKLIRSNRRTIEIRLTQEKEVVVRAPFNMSEDLIERFVWKKQDWIRKKFANYGFGESQYKKKEFKEGEEFPYLGKMYKLKIPGRVQEGIELKDELLLDSRYADYIPRALKVFYKFKAKKYLEKRVELLSRQTGLVYKSIKITSGKRRLGTCSRDNRLTFTYLLVMMPEEISDYIIYHELSHISEKNHSAQYWKVVKQFVPDYKQKKKWLKENLYLYNFLD
jgi:hypothetical protein